MLPPPYSEGMGRFGASEGMTFASHGKAFRPQQTEGSSSLYRPRPDAP